MTVESIKLLSDEKLRALMETADAADVKEIAAELRRREGEAADAPATEDEGGGGASIGAFPVGSFDEAARKAEAKELLTYDELHTLCEGLRERYTGHLCEVCPFDSDTWTGGYVAGVIEDRRAVRALMAIMTDQGRRIVKVYGSGGLKILDGMAAPQIHRHTWAVDRLPSGKPWAPGEGKRLLEEALAKVGCPARVCAADEVDLTTGKTGKQYIAARVIGATAEKKRYCILYRLRLSDPGGDKDGLIIRRREGPALEILEPDNETARLREEAGKRTKALEGRRKESPELKVLRYADLVKRQERLVEKYRTELKALKKRLRDARAELDEWIKNGGQK